MQDVSCLFDGKVDRRKDEQWYSRASDRPDGWFTTSATACRVDVYDLLRSVRIMSLCSVTKSQNAVAVSFPRILYTHKAETELTPDDRQLVREYFYEVKSFWSDIHARVTKVTVDLLSDAEEGMSFWDMIGEKLEDWAAGPGETKATAVLNTVSTCVVWKD
jgi:hypothetical protein